MSNKETSDPKMAIRTCKMMHKTNTVDAVEVMLQVSRRLEEQAAAVHQKERIMAIRQKAVRELLSTIEVNPDREGLSDTPKRVAKMYDEIFAGYNQVPEDILARTFSDEDHRELIIVRDIPFYSHCEHHMVPFYGVAHVGYIPGADGAVVGISKIARLVECFARRLQIQERMTSQIADSINQVLKARGVAVIITAEHLCMGMRGVQKPGAKTTTSAMRGVFLDNANCARMEFMSLIK